MLVKYAMAAMSVCTAAICSASPIYEYHAEGVAHFTGKPSSRGYESFDPTPKGLTRSGGNVNVQLTIANTGGTDAANVVLTSVKVGSDTAVPLPQSLGTIAAGASVQTTVSVPASVGASGAGSSLTLSGTYTGGTFSSSARITLP